MKKAAAKNGATALPAQYQNKHNLPFIFEFKGGKISNPIQILCRSRESLRFGFIWNDVFSADIQLQ